MTGESDPAWPVTSLCWLGKADHYGVVAAVADECDRGYWKVQKQQERDPG